MRNEGRIIINKTKQLIDESQQRLLKPGVIKTINYTKGTSTVRLNDGSIVPAGLENSFNFFVADKVLVWEQRPLGGGESKYWVICKTGGTPIPPGGSQLLNNGYFEEGIDGLSYWTAYNCTISLSTSIKQSGNSALKITPVVANSPCYVYQFIGVPLVPGELYTQSASFYTPSTNPVRFWLDGTWHVNDEDLSYPIYESERYSRSDDMLATVGAGWQSIYTVSRCPLEGVRLTAMFCAEFQELGANDYIVVDNVAIYGKLIVVPKSSVQTAGIPAVPVDLAVESEELVEDENGEKYVEVLISWTGDGDEAEIAFNRVV